MKNRYYNKLKNTTATDFATSSLIGVLVVFLVLILFSLVIQKFTVPDEVITFMSAIAISAGAFFGGFVCAYKKRRNGFITGVFTGVIIYALVLFFGALIASSAISFGLFSKLLIVLVFSAVGGIIGVNVKKKY